MWRNDNWITLGSLARLHIQTPQNGYSSLGTLYTKWPCGRPLLYLYLSFPPFVCTCRHSAMRRAHATDDMYKMILWPVSPIPAEVLCMRPSHMCANGCNQVHLYNWHFVDFMSARKFTQFGQYARAPWDNLMSLWGRANLNNMVNICARQLSLYGRFERAQISTMLSICMRVSWHFMVVLSASK